VSRSAAKLGRLLHLRQVSATNQQPPSAHVCSSKLVLVTHQQWAITGMSQLPWHMGRRGLASSSGIFGRQMTK